MNDASSALSPSLRKDVLQQAILKALELNEEKRLFLLEGLWVHRYGIKTLQEVEKFKKVIEAVQDSPQVKSSAEPFDEAEPSGIFHALSR